MKIIVSIKQVPDTSGKVAVNPDGTLNRASMQTITNPDDMNALEAALKIKDATGCKVVVVTMGPPPAAGMLREALAMGADEAVLVSAREFGGSDTYATSQILAAAINKIGVGEEDIVMCGRQAIDGDTAQVGPQVAEKLGLPQVTYAEDILDITAGKITIKRRLERGIEVVECPVPCVVTVNGSAAPCRPRNARYVMKYKYARATQEMQDADEDYLNLLQERPYLKITEWSVNDITCEAQELGLSGSPTKVKNIESVVFQAKEAKVLEPSDTAIDEMMKELIVNHTVG